MSRWRSGRFHVPTRRPDLPHHPCFGARRARRRERRALWLAHARGRVAGRRREEAPGPPRRRRAPRGARRRVRPAHASGAQGDRARARAERGRVATAREQRAIRRAVKVYGAGGAAYIEPPPPEQAVPGARGSVTADGFAVPPASAPQVVKDVIAAGNAIAKTPYKWGGGHGRWDDTGYDCSGSVSYALHGAGLLDASLVSGDFAGWGSPGPGRWITDLREPRPRLHGRGGHALRHERSLPDRLPLDPGGAPLGRVRHHPSEGSLATASAAAPAGG